MTRPDTKLSIDATARRRWRRNCILGVLAVGAWLGLALTGFSLLWDYTSRPGQLGAAPVHWPAEAAISPNPGQPTLVMFVHPHCPCTRASLRELAVLMRYAPDTLRAHVFFTRPAEFGDDWVETELWRRAGEIPRVIRHVDSGGQQARLFGAHTSGCVALYDETRALRFHGGITFGRGHEGDNRGRSELLACLAGGAASPASAPVFGCELVRDEEAAAWN